VDKIIEQMLTQHETVTLADKKNSIKEIMQEIVLCGLSRAGFFKSAAFYGGTALRIFYGIERFSEDLDFSLAAPDPDFDFGAYLPTLEKEVRSYGLNFRVEPKAKTADSDVKSAFLKGSTREHMLIFYADEQTAKAIGGNEVVKVKFEVDINPPEFAGFERKYRLLPIPYEITLYDMPSLFAGKIHAVICRGWKNRVKGRDLYDFVFFRKNRTQVNLPHLTARLAQTGNIAAGAQPALADIKKMLCGRFDSIDYGQAKADVLPFIKNPAEIEIWSADFFKGITIDML